MIANLLPQTWAETPLSPATTTHYYKKGRKQPVCVPLTLLAFLDCSLSAPLCKALGSDPDGRKGIEMINTSFVLGLCLPATVWGREVQWAGPRNKTKIYAKSMLFTIPKKV